MTIREGLARYGDDPLLLPRVKVAGETDLEAFVQSLGPAEPAPFLRRSSRPGAAAGRKPHDGGVRGGRRKARAPSAGGAGPSPRWSQPSRLLAVGIRLHHLGKEPLWNDEGFTWWAIGQSWHDLWTLVPQGDPHPPFYYSLLKLWTALAGQSEAGLRGLSVLFAAATVPVVYLAGRTLGGARDGAWTGAAAALLFALSPLHLHYAQEARPYAGLTFAASLAFAGALWLVLHPGAARRPLLGWGRGVAADEPSARPAWLALVVGTALALWFHNLGVYLAAALGLALLAWLARDLRWDRSAFANLALAGALVLLAWSPWWPWLLRQTRDVGEAWYLPFPTSAIVLKVLSSLFGLGYSIPTRALRGRPRRRPGRPRRHRPAGGADGGAPARARRRWCRSGSRS